MKSKNINVVSISGGMTSHFMIKQVQKCFPNHENVFVYCDTGAEHEGTYKFLKDTRDFFNIDIVCLRLHMPKERGKGCQYKIVNLEDCKPNYKPFLELMQKYGRPYNPGGKFCTDQMKTQIYRKYCNERFGKGNYTTWIGYRNDALDVSRVWGHSLSGSLSKHFAIPKIDQGEFYIDCKSIYQSEGLETLIAFIEDSRVTPVKDDMINNNLVKRIIMQDNLGYRFLFEISDYDKDDIVSWWSTQDFSLDLPNHAGNCIFCIEKTVNQLSYLCHTQPKSAQEWIITLEDNSIPDKARALGEMVMYRNGGRKMTFQEIYNEAIEQPLTYWEEKVGLEKRLSPCAQGSCELFNTEEMLD